MKDNISISDLDSLLWKKGWKNYWKIFDELNTKLNQYRSVSSLPFSITEKDLKI